MLSAEAPDLRGMRLLCVMERLGKSRHLGRMLLVHQRRMGLPLILGINAVLPDGHNGIRRWRHKGLLWFLAVWCG